MNSILSSVKHALTGMAQDDTFFDSDLIMHINSVFSVLRQLGCGPAEGYQIENETNTWDEFLQDEPEKMQLVKTYLVMRVRQMFDPPTNGTVLQAFERQIAELEWRISTLCDPGGQP